MGSKGGGRRQLSARAIGGGGGAAGAPSPAEAAIGASAPSMTSAELRTRFVDATLELDSGALDGAPVPIRALRAQTSSLLPGEQFTEYVKKLANDGKVSLHRHDFPAGLTAQQKAEMIPDGQGGNYIAMSWRR
jgi:hypothetical protein